MVDKNPRDPWSRECYADLVGKALRRVARDILVDVARNGLHEPNHYYISFRTSYAGVFLPDHLRQTYPQDMTIVLQNRFDDLDVDDEGFSVTLWFRSAPTRIKLPFAAMTTFIDPSLDFALRFGSLSPSLLESQESKPLPDEKTGIDDELKNINKIDSYRLKDREKNPNESRTHSKGVVVPINRFQKRSKNNDKSP